MNLTTMLKPPPPPRAVLQWSEAPLAPPSHLEPPPVEERLGEILPLIFVVPVAGPPVICLVGAWVLFALMLTGPFLLLVTFVLAAVILLAIPAAILAPPYLLARHLRNRRPRRRRPIGVGLATRRLGAQLFSGPAPDPSAAAHLNDRTETPLTTQGL